MVILYSPCFNVQKLSVLSHFDLMCICDSHSKELLHYLPNWLGFEWGQNVHAVKQELKFFYCLGKCYISKCEKENRLI